MVVQGNVYAPSGRLYSHACLSFDTSAAHHRPFRASHTASHAVVEAEQPGFHVILHHLPITCILLALWQDLVKSHDIEVGQETAYEAFLGALAATDSQPAAKVADANK